MINIKNLFKTYKSKSGKVEALKNINIFFSNKELTFIIGKSGSGKSTLLNMISTYDHFNSGEIEFCGKKFSKLKEREKEYYRNKYIGFVFQDFNLLADYTVEENIAIPLYFQNIKDTNDLVKQALEKVELQGFEKRKISELSSGQQQRVAIARAIIKNPSILLCDEPTGNLDEETSISIIQLLKKLSEDCLVIVVSHSSFLANNYGDRVLTLKDGEIIKEIDNRKIEEKENLTLNFSRNKLNIRKKLFFVFQLFKKRFIFALIMILISTFSLTIYSTSSSISNKTKQEILTLSMMEKNASFVSYEKKLLGKYPNDGEISNINVNMDDSDVQKIKDETKVNNVDIVYDFYCNRISNLKNKNTNTDYFEDEIQGFCEISDSFIERYNFKLYGSLPRNDNEVVISKYFFDMFKEYGYSNLNLSKEINQYEDIFNLTLYVYDSDKKYVESKDLVIVGVLDTNFNAQRYLPIYNNKYERSLIEEYSTYLNNSPHNIIYLKEGYFTRNLNGEINSGVYHGNEYLYNVNDPSFEYLLNYKINEPRPINSLDYIVRNNEEIMDQIKDKVVLFDENFSSSDSILLPFSIYDNDLAGVIDNRAYFYCINNWELIQQKISDDHLNWGWMDFYNYIVENNYSDPIYQLYDKATTIKEYIWYTLDNFDEHVTFTNHDYFKDLVYNVKIAGFFDNTDFDNPWFAICSESLYDRITKDIGFYVNDYKYVLIPLTKNYQDNLRIINLIDKKIYDHDSYIDEVDMEYVHSYFECENEFTNNYHSIEYTLKPIQSLLKYIAMALIVVTPLLIYFYCSNLTKIKKKEIGILESMGASKKDIFEIFSINFASIGFIITLLSIILSFIFSTYFKQVFINSFEIISLINYSYEQVLSIIIILGVSIVLGTTIPLARVLHKKIIKNIRE